MTIVELRAALEDLKTLQHMRGIVETAISRSTAPKADRSTANEPPGSPDAHDPKMD